MGTLFDITAEFQQLYEMATDSECDEQVFSDTLEALTGELEAKSKGYVSVIKQLEMEMTQANITAEMFKQKAKVRENRIKRMKEALLYAMTEIGEDKVEAGDWTIKVQKNGGLQPLVIDGEVPQSYKQIIYQDDKALIRKALEDGKQLEFAHLEERGKHIVIK